MDHNKNMMGFFECLIKDDRLLPSHISMYVSLFQFWSLNHFQNPFRICREIVMESSKIRSLATYHKCIRELHQAGFIIYSPSYNSFKGSLIEMMDTEYLKDYGGMIFQVKKIAKHKENCFSIPKFYEVELYFNERDLPSKEATQFYSFYQSKNWSLNNKKLMTSWQAAARNWISNLKKPNHNLLTKNNQ